MPTDKDNLDGLAIESSRKRQSIFDVSQSRRKLVEVGERPQFEKLYSNKVEPLSFQKSSSLDKKQKCCSPVLIAVVSILIVAGITAAVILSILTHSKTNNLTTEVSVVPSQGSLNQKVAESEETSEGSSTEDAFNPEQDNEQIISQKKVLQNSEQAELEAKKPQNYEQFIFNLISQQNKKRQNPMISSQSKRNFSEIPSQPEKESTKDNEDSEKLQTLNKEEEQKQQNLQKVQGEIIDSEIQNIPITSVELSKTEVERSESELNLEHQQ